MIKLDMQKAEISGIIRAGRDSVIREERPARRGWQELLDEAQAAHANFDGKVQGWLERHAARTHVYCARGCSSCCSLVVNATFPEALLAARSLSPIQADRVRRHASRLLGRLPGVESLAAYLRLHRAEIGSCPFLDADGSCGIYGVRPLSCRSLLSTREPRWCGADFAKLTREEKEEFLAGLDRSVVAFPMHYVAATQELGQQTEAEIMRQMREAVGFSLYGSFPFLVFLALEHSLSAIIPQGRDVTRQFLEQQGLFHPFLVMPD